MKSIAGGFTYDTRGPSGRRMRRSPHAVGGSQADHPDVRFPVCTCDSRMTLYLSLDCGSKRLRKLGLWTGRLLLFACDSATEEDGRTHVDYSNPKAPVVLNQDGEEHHPGSALDTVPLLLRLEPSDEASTVGCLIGSRAVDAELDPSVRSCPRCRTPMGFVAQYVETISDIPHDKSRTAMLGSPYLQRWYACRFCKIVSWLGPEALNSYD